MLETDYLSQALADPLKFLGMSEDDSSKDKKNNHDHDASDFFQALCGLPTSTTMVRGKSSADPPKGAHYSQFPEHKSALRPSSASAQNIRADILNRTPPPYLAHDNSGRSAPSPSFANHLNPVEEQSHRIPSARQQNVLNDDDRNPDTEYLLLENIDSNKPSVTMETGGPPLRKILHWNRRTPEGRTFAAC
eukprot:2323726-Rhodomonas_salina.1